LKIIFSNNTINEIKSYQISSPQYFTNSNYFTNNNTPNINSKSDYLTINNKNNSYNEGKEKYKSGHLSLIIKNLINFFCFMFINFFVYYSLIPLEDFELKKLLIDRENVRDIKYDNLNEYVLQKLKRLNSRLDEKNFISCCYSYIFEPIKSCKKFL